MSAIADILGVPVSYLFAELESPGEELSAEDRRLRELKQRPETIELIRLCYAIPNSEVRRRFLAMVKAVAAAKM